MNTLDKIELRKFVAPELIFGNGARFLAGRYARNFGARKVLIVTDKGVISSGWVKDITDCFDSEGLDYFIFSDVNSNPRENVVMAGAKIYKEELCNVIVAVGGGSPMDCAKGIGIVSSNNRHILEFEGVDQVAVPGPPLICIPTTAGSSADVSQFAIINDTKRKVKIAIISKTVVPDVALIDPVTLETMSTYLTACSAMDALTHAVEAYVSNAHSAFTDLHALEAIRLISSNIVPAVNKLGDIRILGDLMLGSLHAGLAFSNASLGAVHAMAHSLGGLLDQPHGECNAVLLKHVINYNFDAVPDRYKLIGEAMGLNFACMALDDIKQAIYNKLNDLQDSIGINKTLRQMGVVKEHVPELSINALRDPCIATNPRMPNQKDIEVIYEEAL